MAIGFGQVICPSNAATVIVAAASATALGSQSSPKRVVTIANFSSFDIYLGDSNVTSSNGFLLKAGGTPLTLSLSLSDSVYGKGSANSPIASWIEGGAT